VTSHICGRNAIAIL